MLNYAHVYLATICAQNYAGIICQGLMDSQSHVHYLFQLLVLVHLT